MCHVSSFIKNLSKESEYAHKTLFRSLSKAFLKVIQTKPNQNQSTKFCYTEFD
jgi:hypothetical protein